MAADGGMQAPRRYVNAYLSQKHVWDAIRHGELAPGLRANEGTLGQVDLQERMVVGLQESLVAQELLAGRVGWQASRAAHLGAAQAHGSRAERLCL